MWSVILPLPARNTLFLNKQMPMSPVFDGGYGSAYLAKMVENPTFLQKKLYSSATYEIGMVNAVHPDEELEEYTYDWARIS